MILIPIAVVLGGCIGAAVNAWFHVKRGPILVWIGVLITFMTMMLLGNLDRGIAFAAVGALAAALVVCVLAALAIPAPAVGATTAGAAFHPVTRSYNPKTNTLAIAAFVTAFVFTPLAIPLGHVARSQIRETGEQGSGLATAGLVIAYIWVTVIVGALVYMIAPEL